MAIRGAERTSTDEILRDSRFHRAAVKADPRASHLAERVQKAESDLKQRRTGSDEKEDTRTEAFALLVRADFELDEACRSAELDVFAAVNKRRDAEGYRACYPRGLSDLVALRGQQQKLQVDRVVDGLKKHFASLHDKHGAGLAELAAEIVTAETKWREAERDGAATDLEQRLARIELVRQLQKNEGALAEFFPGQRRRVRSFFRPTRRRGATVPGEAPNGVTPTA